MPPEQRMLQRSLSNASSVGPSPSQTSTASMLEDNPVTLQLDFCTSGTCRIDIGVYICTALIVYMYVHI